ncbi:MAG: apolipoprotein N-acyltransferase [Niabella sp.]
MKSKYYNLIRCFIGVVLLWAAWPVSPFTILLFVAWLPMFFLADNVQGWKKFFGYTYLHMLLWNLLVTWWVAMSTIVGGIGAFVANSLIMCLPWMIYFFTKKYYSEFVAGISLIAYWIAYEYIHHNWDLSWPWLSLGNAFATHPGWVQWYEYTGASGGTLWVLLANLLMFKAFKVYRADGRSGLYFRYLFSFLLIICLPIGISALINKKNLTLTHNKYNVVVVQPNYDPWDEKFEPGKQEAHLQEMLALSQKQIDPNTRLVIWPETAIPYQVDEDLLKENYMLSPLWGFLKDNPHINLLTGLEGFRQFDHKVSRYAKAANEGLYYEMYNSATLFDSSQVQIYHKSKLVPGVEVLPGFLTFMASAFEKFGGTTGGYARDSVARVLNTTNNSYHITPAICYESIYGDYLADFNRQQADIICIMTNDGWWGKTPGYRQHESYARLRAIEARKWVARSANTGISCFIDPYGNVVQQLPWDKRGALKQDIAAFVTETFYTRHGDWLSRFFSIVSVIFLITGVIFAIRKRRIAATAKS